MCEADKQYIKECRRDIQTHKGLLNLMICDIEDEKISENLAVAIQYIEKAIGVLSAIEELSNTLQE